MLKRYRVVGWCGVGWMAHEILVSAQGPLVLDFGFLALGLWGLGPGLDNYKNLCIFTYIVSFSSKTV